MKKLILGKALDQVVATCNFCAEHSKPCVRGALPFIAKKTTYKYVVDDYELSLLGGYKTKKRPEYHAVVDGEKENQDYADICHDCINQLAKLIK